MNQTKNYLTWLDYVIFGIVLSISSLIGLYYRFTGGRQKTFKEYLLADQKMSIIPVAFSLMASFMSAITLLGVSKEHYTFGTQFIIVNFWYIFATPIVCYVFLPVFFRLQKFSVYEYLELRFGVVARVIASVAFSLQMILYLGVVLYAPALALSAVTGISETMSIIAIGLVCTFYSAIGGMKAVLITDVFQSILMFTSVFAVVVRGVRDFGISGIFHFASEGQRLELFEVRHTFWNLSIGGIINYCSIYGVNQAQVQRLLTVKSLKKAQGALWLQWIILTFLSAFTALAGLVIYAEFHNCDPLLNKEITNSDQLLPYYVVRKLGEIPGVLGLFISGIFSGSLSSVSSGLNSLAAVTLNDYLIPLFPSLKKRESLASSLGKFFAIVYGVICIGFAFASQTLGPSILQVAMTIFGAVGGPLLSLFTLGMGFKMVNQKGAVAGLTLGLVLNMWIGFGQPKPTPPIKPLVTDGCLAINETALHNGMDIEIALTNISSTTAFPSTTNRILDVDPNVDLYNPLHELYAISYMWVSVVGFLTTMVVGLLVSLCTGGNPKEIDQRLMFSFKKCGGESSKEYELKSPDLHETHEIEKTPCTNQNGLVSPSDKE